MVGHRARAARQSTLLPDLAGVVFTEYLIVLVVVSLVCAGALVLLGVPLVQYYRDVVSFVVSPVP